MEDNNTQEQELPEISAASFTLDVNNKMNKAAIAEKYGISERDVSVIVKDLGLVLARTVKPRFKLIRDLAVAKAENEVVSEDIPQTPAEPAEKLDVSSSSSMN